ncbi:MAG: hypothetical protein NTZ04_06115 [Chloroflexi bacterium]|nr:hypothetical protein [Chloroflexota bacterium]
MNKLTMPIPREIITDFAAEIQAKKRQGPKPAKDVIDFRTDRRDGKERDIYYVPIDLLRYRKDNGRISSDVLNYQKAHGLLVETSATAQHLIEGFLKEKDKEKTEELLSSMEYEGQREAAIITSDGFLINGNRRLMALKILRKKHPADPRFQDMRVVILPGKDAEGEGGPPTLLEIEQIENRYQLQSEAKAEYYAFDRALSMRRKIAFGMSLEQQLRDDPIYAGLNDKKFREEVQKVEKEYLKPLECVDRYLEQLGRNGLYSTVSTGLGDPEGRWQAFLDYYTFVYQKLEDDKKRVKLGVAEDEVGKVEVAAFKIIRRRELPDLPKLHKIMRDLPKMLANEDAKREILKLADVELDLTKEERFDENGKEYDERRIDKIWGAKHVARITKHVKKAQKCYQHTKGQETPLTLLQAALGKLNHEDMDPEALATNDLDRARKLVVEIRQRAIDLEKELYQCQKVVKQLDHKPKS